MPTTFRQVIGNLIAFAGLFAATKARTTKGAILISAGAFLLAIRVGDLEGHADE